MKASPSDVALLAVVGQRDLDAMRALYDRHAAWLAVRLSRRCNDQDLVADAVQDTFVAVWQKPEGFRGDGDVAAWLWGIAIRRLVSRLRRRPDVATFTGPAGTVPAAEDQVAIVAIALPAVALAGLLVPGWAPSIWLLPALGFVAVVLALSTWMSPLRSAIGVSLAWLAIVWFLVAQAGSPDAVLEAQFQAGDVVLAMASIAIFFVRARHLRELRPRRNWS